MKVTQQQAADMLNVSKPSVEHAVKVKNEGAPELFAAIEQGVNGTGNLFLQTHESNPKKRH